MAKAGRGSDQFMVRLPDGLRDRIKTIAEGRGRSMNAEIVRALEKEFPEPWPLDQRLENLFQLVSALRKVRGYQESIDDVTDAVLDTVTGIANGRVPEVDEETKSRVRVALEEWTRSMDKQRLHSKNEIEDRYNSSEQDDE